MTNGWNFEETLEGNGGGAKTNFTQFPEGITRIRILDETPFFRWNHWLPQFSRKITCPGFGCPIDALIKEQKAKKITPTYQSNRSWALNIYNYDTEQVEINEQGIKYMEELREVLEDLTKEGKKLSDVIIKVRKRKGGDGKATWRFDIESYEPMGEAELAGLESKTDFATYFAPPTFDQVQQLLDCTMPTAEEFNRIMGYGVQTEEDGDIGLETE